MDVGSNCIGFRSLFICVHLRYYCKIHFWVKVGNLRMQIKPYINRVRYTSERRSSQQFAFIGGKAPRLVSTRILLYQLVSARESVVLDREQYDPTKRHRS